MKYISRSDRQIHQLAQDCIDGKIFGTWQVADAVKAFLPLTSTETVDQLREAGVIHVFQYFDKALPNKVDNMPVFASLSVLNQYDVARLETAIHRLTRHKGG